MGAARTWLVRHLVPFLLFPSLLALSATLIAGTAGASTLAPLTLTVGLITATLLGVGFGIDGAVEKVDDVNPAYGFWTLMAGTVVGLLGGISIVGAHVTEGGSASAAGFTFVGLTLVLVLLGILKDRRSVAYVALGITAAASLADGLHWPLLLICILIAAAVARGWDRLRRAAARIPGLRHTMATRTRGRTP